MSSATSGKDAPYPTTLYWDPQLLEYNFGDYHPMSPTRLDATMRLVRALGLDEGPNIRVETPRIPGDDVLELAHTPEYVRSVRAVSEDPTRQIPECGLGTEDTPGYAGIHESSARLVGGSYQGAVDLLSGRAVHAVNFSGGMHHASASKASGFCVYNDCAVAIRHLLDQGTRRVVYIDVDGHHGDGTQSIFYDEPRVMTISLHETGLTLFPGSGFANEIGTGEAAGTSVNVALPSRSDDSQWLRAYDAVVPQLVREFRPEVIVSQHGCDSHFRDDLTHLRVSVDGQRQIALQIARLADEVCEGRWLATGGGGYDCHNAVPRSWAHLVGVAAGHPVDLTARVPQSWRDYMRQKYGGEPPEFMGDDVDLWWRSWEIGFDPNDETDRTIMATRREVFPHWGLDPWYD